MRTRTVIWLAALSCALALAAAFAAATGVRSAAAGGSTPARSEHAGSGHGTKNGAKRQERFLYVSTIAQSASDPDFIAVIGADPRRRDFGKIVNRIDTAGPAAARQAGRAGQQCRRSRPSCPAASAWAVMATDYATWLHVFNVNLFATALLARGLFEPLKAAKGSIINVTSIAGGRVHPFAGSAYLPRRRRWRR